MRNPSATIPTTKVAITFQPFTSRQGESDKVVEVVSYTYVLIFQMGDGVPGLNITISNSPTDVTENAILNLSSRIIAFGVRMRVSQEFVENEVASPSIGPLKGWKNKRRKNTPFRGKKYVFKKMVLAPILYPRKGSPLVATKDRGRYYTSYVLKASSTNDKVRLWTRVRAFENLVLAFLLFLVAICLIFYLTSSPVNLKNGLVAHFIPRKLIETSANV